MSWLTHGYDLKRTGYNPLETTIGIGNAASLHVRWTANLGAVLIAQPVEAANVKLRGGTRNVVYEGTEHGDFYALDAATGRTLWHRKQGSIQGSCKESTPDGVYGIGGTAMIDRQGNVVFVAAGDGSIHSLDLATGRETPGWPLTHTFQPAEEHVFGGINERNGKLYVTVASSGCDTPPFKGQIFEIDIRTRRVVHRFYPATPKVNGGGIWGPGGASIDPANGHVFVATGNALKNPESYSYSDHVVELGPSLNVLGANYPNLANYPGLVSGDTDFGSTPVLYRPSGCPTQQVAAKNKYGLLVVYNEGALNAGYTQLLEIATVKHGQFNGTPAWYPKQNMLYVSNSSDSVTGKFFHGLVALHAGSNCQLSLAWQDTVGPNLVNVSPPTVANGIVYYGDGPGNTERAFNAKSGALLWSSGSTIHGAVYSAPMVVNGMLYVPSWDDKLYAFGP
ncbi:MAG TPA: PQQ-binding-like beta-propeller repeat protein [Gaiellaceae bacterium]|nr:PQQ-binding-like beta-propeller repeat protein [Gaiellaceae bacterium]